MNIVTFYNYPDEDKYFDMLKIWLMCVIESKKKTNDINKIMIITEKLSDRCNHFINSLNLEFIEIINGKYYDNIDKSKSEKWIHNVYFKFYNLCKLKEPYIFIDADAFIMRDLNEVLEASKTKPFICINHQTIPGHTNQFDFKFLNTGFTIVSDPTFFDFEKITNMEIKYNCQGTDQMMVYNYCKVINYDYTHPKIHYGYNSCSAFKKVLDNGKIISDGIPENHEIYVLHYWYHYKPWTKCDCCVKGKDECEIYNKWLDEINFYFLKYNKDLNISYRHLEKNKENYFFEIQKLISSNKKFFVGRFSGHETLFCGLKANNKINLNHYLIKNMRDNAGINLLNDDDINKYYEIYLKSVVNCSKLCIFTSKSMAEQAELFLHEIIQNHTFNSFKLIHNHSIEFHRYFESSKYILDKVFSNKKILLILAFENTFAEQKSKLNKIFPKSIFGNAQFYCYKPPQQFCGNNDGKSWLVHYEKMKIDISNISKEFNFDICLASCGGFGMPISDYIYSDLNKSVIYMGGILQVMFGIKCKRYDNEPHVNQYYNNEWIYPLNSDKINNFKSHEGGAYW